MYAIVDLSALQCDFINLLHLYENVLYNGHARAICILLLISHIDPVMQLYRPLKSV